MDFFLQNFNLKGSILDHPCLEHEVAFMIRSAHQALHQLNYRCGEQGNEHGVQYEYPDCLYEGYLLITILQRDDDESANG